jgi:putative acetyltransferase
MIRQYKNTDDAAIVDIWFEASRIATPFLSDEFLQQERDNVRNIHLKHAETWVYEDDGNAVGFLSLIGNEVGAIFVRPECQGRGIGRRLMDHAVSIRDELFLDVFEGNASGRGFYDHYGYRIARRHIHDLTGHVLLRLTYSPGGD